MTVPRTSRLVTFVKDNRYRLVADASVLLAWIVFSMVLFGWLSQPQWLHYLATFGGVAVYARLTPDWGRRSSGNDDYR